MTPKKICPNCGCNDIDEKDVFCFECGYNLQGNIQNLKMMEPDLNIASTTDLHIDAKMVHRYIELENNLKDLDNIEMVLSQQQTYFNQIHSNLKTQQSNLTQHQNQTRKELNDVEKLKSLTWTSLKARIKGNKEALLEKEEYEYYEAVNQEEIERKHLEQIQKTYNNALNQLEAIKKQVQLKKSIQTEITNILDRACEGVADPVEDQIEREMDMLQNKILPKNRQISILQNGLGQFRNGRRYMESALRNLEEAGGLANWDTFFGGGLIADSMKHSHISDSQYALQSAGRALQNAFQIIPNAPRVHIPHIWQGSGIWDMMFDGFIADMHVRNKIRESRADVQNTFSQLNRTISWVEQQINAVKHEIFVLREKIGQTRQKLTKERKRMLENAIHL